MVIDSHQHFWQFDPARDSWITEEMGAIRKDFLPSDLQPILEENNVDGCIAVQADQSEEETLFLLKLAKENSFIKGVVGWLDICADNFEKRLNYFSKFEHFCGIRHILQAEPDGFMLNDCFLKGIEILSKYNLSYDILIHYKQFPEVLSFVKQFPNQKFILDHLGKPNIKSKEINEWKSSILQLKTFPNVYCKISGMVTEADFNSWKSSDFTPYLDIVFETFGVDRILYGSDWPVCLLASSYKEQLAIVKNYISKFSIEEQSKIMGENSLKIYNR